MKKLLSLTLTFLLLFTFVGCSNQETKTSENEPVAPIEKESEQNSTYELTKEVINVEAKDTKIFYPQIKGYPGELLMDYMNQSLKRIADLYANEDIYTNVKMDYEVTRMDENIVSVLFKGTCTIQGHGEINIQQSINLDMNSSNEITYDNFVKSKEEVMKILEEKGLTEAEGIRIYFKGQDIVFYYMPLDDSAKEFIELNVPEKELKEYINTDFGEVPAS